MSKFYAIYLVEENLKCVTNSWEECKEKTNGKNARYMSFTNSEKAYEWLKNGAEYEKKSANKPILKDAIYFDSGKKGRLSFVKTRLTDVNGKDLITELDEVNLYLGSEIANAVDGATLSIKEYNGNKVCEILNNSITNNMGELLAFIMACKLVVNRKEKNQEYPKLICGDSKLVLDYWSKGSYNGKALSKKTVNLISIAKKIRDSIEGYGVTFEHVSGDHNPADLGDHR